jgi:flagellar assembly protein FliH
VLRGDRAAGVATIGRLADLRDHANRTRVNPEYLATITAQGYRAGEQEGFAAGHAAGYADGLVAARAELARLAEDVRTLMRSVERVVAEARAADRLRLEAVQSLIAEAGVDLAEAVLAHELASLPAGGRAALARALDLVGDETVAVVHLHPDDAASCADAPLPEGATIRIVADPAVDRGGCTIDFDGWHLDARFGAALERARAALGGMAS